MVIDLHTHTLLSDGELVPAELAQRAAERGYRAIGLTDHVDMATIDHVAPIIVKAARELSICMDIIVIAGVEITHVPPGLISQVASYARELGIELVVAHGETLVEPVIKGTNKAALQSAIDILAHPGLITEDEAAMAKKAGICLELSARKGHSLSNGHVARIAKKCGASLIVGSDAHGPGDLLSAEFYNDIVFGAGLDSDDLLEIRANSETVLKRIRNK